MRKVLNLNDWLVAVARYFEKDENCNLAIAYKEDIPDNKEELMQMSHQMSVFLSLMVKRVVYIKFEKPNGEWKEGDIGYYYSNDLKTTNIKFKDGKAKLDDEQTK